MGAVSPPIFQSSLFVYDTYDNFSNAISNIDKHYVYTRGNNPTVKIAEKKIAKLENAESAKCFGSGMAAISSAILSCVKSGDHIISVKTVYSPTYEFLSSYLSRFNIETTFVDGMKVDDFENALRDNTKIIYLESPTTFLFQLQDLRKISLIAKKYNITTIIDNSWASPYFQNPIDFGIDVVVHSCSKYLSGHSDVVAGVMVGTNEFIDAVSKSEYALLGGILHPFDAWLILRGIRTLPLRMEKHFSSTLRITKYLENHPKILKVNYPFLHSNPQFELAKLQMYGGSGLFTFELKTRNVENIKIFISSLKHFYIGVSWGGYESLILPISAIINNKKTNTILDKMNISPNLIRISVGLENVEYLISDLEQALDKI